MFLKSRQILHLIEKNDGQARIVGGAVRDYLINREIKDIDIATTLTPDEIIKLFESKGIRVIPTGLDFGTVSILLDGEVFEVTTLRKDFEPDGRHTKVIYTKDWTEDASRRDFTINAIYMDVEGKIYDYFGGVRDLQNGEIKFIGVPSDRIKEDYLRILRYFRFHSSHGKGLMIADQLSACAKHKDGLDKISGERIKSEMCKLFVSSNCVQTLAVMEEVKILHKLMEVDEKTFFDFNALKIIMHYLPNPNPIVIIAAFLKVLSLDYISRLSDKWRLSNKEKNFLIRLMESLKFPIQEDYEVRKSIRINGKEEFIDHASLNLAKQRINEPYFDYLLNIAKNFTSPHFPLSGKILQDAGYMSGKRLGDALKLAEELWERSNYTYSKEDLIEIVQTQIPVR